MVKALQKIVVVVIVQKITFCSVKIISVIWVKTVFEYSSKDKIWHIYNLIVALCHIRVQSCCTNILLPMQHLSSKRIKWLKLLVSMSSMGHLLWTRYSSLLIYYYTVLRDCLISNGCDQLIKSVYVYVVIYQLYLNCIVLIVLVLISFSHGYSAILAAKLMIKLDLTWLDLSLCYFL